MIAEPVTSSATSFSTGFIILQGPHQAAQKSTRTSPLAVTALKFLLLRTLMFSLGFTSGRFFILLWLMTMNPIKRIITPIMTIAPVDMTERYYLNINIYRYMYVNYCTRVFSFPD